MKFPRLFSVFLVLAAIPCLSGQSAPTPAAASADADYAAFNAFIVQDNAPGEFKDIGAEKYLTWLDGHDRAVLDAALAFYAAHPADPRRWELVMLCVQFPPRFIKGFGPDVATKGQDAVIFDETAAVAWRQQSAALVQALLTAPDTPPELREKTEWGMFAQDFRATSVAKAKGEPYDFSGFRARFDAHVVKYVALDEVAARAANYLGALEKNIPGASKEIWQHLLEAPNAALRERAAAQLKFLDLASKPLEMAYTATDGRSVDLKSLRGKVVLIDFWATWCGPCKEEIPNVKKVYAAYHDKGFEVVGISLENGKLTPKDTAEQTAAKLEKAKKVLTDFTTKEEMPWPQYFDGKFWKNEISTQYSLQSIPAMFLLDQDGKVVSTNARGELLEATVKKLLKL